MLCTPGCGLTKFCAINLTHKSCDFAVVLQLLDFSLVADGQKKKYFAAVQTGLDKNYKPMETIFAAIIMRTLAAS